LKVNEINKLFSSKKEDRVMLTGRHIVRDVSCKLCLTKLGWIYEYATEENQRYKEGRVILERALVTEQVSLLLTLSVVVDLFLKVTNLKLNRI
jgi:hypothetical protein